jgi:hypothetical protein
MAFASMSAANLWVKGEGWGSPAPTENTILQLPSDGVFNFTTVDIPAGVTVTFSKNTTNTPVYILATGDVKKS